MISRTKRPVLLQGVVELSLNRRLNIGLHIGGSVNVLGAGRRPVTDISVDKAHFHATAGQPLRVDLDGLVDQTPLKLSLRLRLSKLGGFTRIESRLPFWLEAQGAGCAADAARPGGTALGQPR